MYSSLCNELLPHYDILVQSCDVRSDPPCAELDGVLQRLDVPHVDFPLLASRPARKGWRYHQSFIRRPGWSAPPDHGTTFYGCLSLVSAKTAVRPLLPPGFRPASRISFGHASPAPWARNESRHPQPP